MADPMTPERLAEIRERAESVKTWKGYHAEPVPQLLDADVPALLAEVERLRLRLISAEQERDAARGVAQSRADLADQMSDERNRLRAELATVLKNYGGLQALAIRLEGERDEARVAVAEEIDRAIAAEEERDQLRRTAAAWRTEYERISRQMLRRHWAWQSAKRGRRTARRLTDAALRGWAKAANERDDLTAQLKQPCGTCHPCTNWADETWRQAGRRPPHVHEWDELKAGTRRVREQHPPESRGGRTVCGACLGSDEEPMPWPCPTMAALDGTEAGR